MVAPFFSDEYIKKMEPYIQKTTDKLLDALRAKGCADGPVDLVEEFALPLPSYVSCISQLDYQFSNFCLTPLPQVIYTMLGVPFSDLAFLTKQNAIRTNGSSTARQASEASKYDKDAPLI